MTKPYVSDLILLGAGMAPPDKAAKVLCHTATPPEPVWIAHQSVAGRADPR